MPVGPVVLDVELVTHGLELGGREGAGWAIDGQFVRLPRITHLDLAHEPDALAGETFPEEGVPPFRFHCGEDPVDLADVFVPLGHDPGARELVLEVRHQQAERRCGSGLGSTISSPICISAHSRLAWSGPAPPNATMTRSRGS